MLWEDHQRLSGRDVKTKDNETKQICRVSSWAVHVGIGRYGHGYHFVRPSWSVRDCRQVTWFCLRFPGQVRLTGRFEGACQRGRRGCAITPTAPGARTSNCRRVIGVGKSQVRHLRRPDFRLPSSGVFKTVLDKYRGSKPSKIKPK